MNELKVRVEEEEERFNSKISKCNKDLAACKDELIIQERINTFMEKIRNLN